MALSDSMFLFEIVINDLKILNIECEEYEIVGQFADIFKLQLKYPVLKSISRKLNLKKVKQKNKVRRSNIKFKKSLPKIEPQTGQSILIINKKSILISFMKKYPLEITIYKERNPELKLGSTNIAWSKVYINYLLNLNNKSDSPPAYTKGEYNVYDETTSKRIATINMCLKLTCLNEKITSRFISLSKDRPDTFMYTQINSKPLFVLSTVKSDNPSEKIEALNNVSDIENGIKFQYGQMKNNGNNLIAKQKTNELQSFECEIPEIANVRKTQISLSGCFKSDSNIVCKKIANDTSSLSTTDFIQRNCLYHYIFGNPEGPFGNQVYYVGYFTVEKEMSDHLPQETSETQSSEKSMQKSRKLKFKKCDSECLSKKETSTCSESICSLDLPEEAAHLISITKCKEVECENKKHRELTLPPDERILLDLTSLKTDCCTATDITEKIEEIIGEVTTKMEVSQDPCYCTCECRFGFMKKTTYCSVCGGYEIAGEELARKTAQEIPIPCPIYHKLVDKNKLKTWSTSGSESKKKVEDSKSLKTSSGQKAAVSEKRLTISEKKSVESEKESKKGKKNRRDDRFKFNYGYKAPQIGHSKCALPCSGTLENVPKRMGWLWTADNVPGMKFRPMWKPGAANKHVVRLLKIARNPGEIISKKKRKDAGKKKRPLKRPLLVVHKKNGEYTVTMETMKTYSKPRALNQHPYEDKPVVTYTIGRSDEENRERLKKKEREQRRLERAQRHFIQSAFRDMCQEICLKTYQQALGLLPNAEDPECTCYPALPDAKVTNIDISCSCSDEKSSDGIDTDSDEWIVEFTPPNATFDPTYKGKKIFKVDTGSQYTYLDYRVKLVDRFGNAVPRFFKGPDGKQECSDLGGFWSPDHKWLEINIDGYVAPDGRWAPNNFIGPNGEQVDAETGKFQAMNVKWLVVGIDGYIDNQGKWKFYSKQTDLIKKKHRNGNVSKKGKTLENKYEKTANKSETSWSCFGDASPKQLSKLGIIGHGEDKKLLISMLQDMLARGENVKIPQPSKVFYLPNSKFARKDLKAEVLKHKSTVYQERYKCQHPVPSDKGIIAVDSHGNKTYFRLRDHDNKRPKERLAMLTEQGISLSSFHVPCFHSFINSEVMKQQQRDRIIALSNKNVATQVNHGWKPGAVSKRLLRMLNKAKLHKSTANISKQTKRIKKEIEKESTLTVLKKEGVYTVKLKAVTENSKENVQYTPLIYTVESMNNKSKLKMKHKIERRLVRTAVDKVWSNAYDPNACKQNCYEFYKQVVGNFSDVEDNYKNEDGIVDTSCSFEDEEVISSCDSSEIEWEMHFTPPTVPYCSPKVEDLSY